jgi:hypothetical protein
VILLRNRHQRFLRKRVRLWGEEASSSSADVSSNVEQQETVEDYVESSRSQEQSQKRSMEMEEDYSQESSVSAQEQSSVSAEEEYSATETSDTSQVASAESVSFGVHKRVRFRKMESSDISQESASTVSVMRKRVRLCRDYVESSRSQEQSQKRSMEMEEDYSQESSVSAQEQSFGFCGRRIQRNRNVRYFSGCECRKCFEFTREFGFGKGKQ